MLKKPPLELCKIRNMTKMADGILFDTENGLLLISAINENIVKVSYTKEKNFLNTSYSVTYNHSVPFETEENQTQYIIKTSEIILVVEKENAQFSYYDIHNNLLLKEPAGGGKHLEAFDVYMPDPDKSQTKSIQTPDGEKTIVTGGSTIYSKTAYHARIDFDFAEDEFLYGLGQQENGILNLRNNTIYLYQANLKNPMPFFMSSKGYGVFIDAYSHMIFCDNDDESYIYCETVDEINYYFIAGTRFDKIIDGYRTLTGKAPMLPKWAFGYMQSREAYLTQDEILKTAKEFRKREIPIDTIIMDWNSWCPGLWGQKSFDSSRFPDPQAMTDALHDMNLHFMISIWPTLSAGDNFDELKEHGYLLNGTTTYNAFDENARKMYWKQTNEGYFKYGTDAWWCDSSEPFTPEWQGTYRLPPAVDYANSLASYKQIGNDNLTNLYPFMHAKGIYENQRNQTEEKRVVNLTRSVYSGQQRFSTIIWSGDICASWKTLKKQIAAGLGMCASGIPYWTLDIGAFFTKNGLQWFWSGDYEDGNKSDGYKELYTRWLQFGAFLPIFRSHGTDTEREPWYFGDKGDVYYDTILKFIRLRYRLLPYIYSLAARVTFDNYTIMRLLTFDFPCDETVYSIDDQYMFGNCFMVCPVTEPGCKSRKIYLPEGKIWYDFWTNKAYEGGKWIDYDTPVDIIPIFVPGGSIIPMTKGCVQSTSEMQNDKIDLYVYSGSDGKFTVYHDSGDNYNYEKGEFLTQEIIWDNKTQNLTIREAQGDYKKILSNIDYNITVIHSEL